MRLFHISDLHIGKKLNDFSLEDDQKHILNQILSAVDEHHPDGVLIAGDVYDSTSPISGSLNIFDDFITELSKCKVQAYIISGNHDSNEKLGYARRLLSSNGIHLSHEFNGELDCHDLGGGVKLYLLPFVRPSDVRRFHPEAKIESYDDAYRTVIENSKIDGKKNILIAHLFAVAKGSETLRSESEVGTTEPVSVSMFDRFDYVALGHIHTPQKVGRDTVRYCGTPLKYSKSEIGCDKSITVVDIDDKVCISTIPLVPLRDARIVRGPIDELISAGKKDNGKNDFIYAEIIGDAPNALDRLREVYPNVANIVYVSEKEEKEHRSVEHTIGKLDAMELFSDLFRESTEKEMNAHQKKIVSEIIDREEVSL